jgi:hypothetical protein
LLQQLSFLLRDERDGLLALQNPICGRLASLAEIAKSHAKTRRGCLQILDIDGLVTIVGDQPFYVLDYGLKVFCGSSGGRELIIVSVDEVKAAVELNLVDMRGGSLQGGQDLLRVLHPVGIGDHPLGAGIHESAGNQGA